VESCGGDGRGHDCLAHAWPLIVPSTIEIPSSSIQALPHPSPSYSRCSANLRLNGNSFVSMSLSRRVVISSVGSASTSPRAWSSLAAAV
jgi:hypothetical protein